MGVDRRDLLQMGTLGVVKTGNHAAVLVHGHYKPVFLGLRLEVVRQLGQQVFQPWLPMQGIHLGIPECGKRNPVAALVIDRQVVGEPGQVISEHFRKATRAA